MKKIAISRFSIILLTAFFLTPTLVSPSDVMAQNSLGQGLRPSARPELMLNNSGNTATGSGRMMSPEQLQQKAQETKQQLQDKKNQALETKCEQFAMRMQEKMQNQEKIKIGWEQRYQNLLSKTSSALDQADKLGISTQKARENLATLQRMISTHLQNMEKLQAQFQTANSSAVSCLEKTQEIASLAKASNQQIQTLRKEAQDIRNYIQNTLRPSLVEIKTALREKVGIQKTTAPAPVVDDLVQ